MRVLILGGTIFLGRHICEAALAAGHEVTLFNRGQTAPDLFKGRAEVIHGDRGRDLEKLKHGNWDVCIDPSGMLPGHVELSTWFLKDRVEHYSYISSISVYRDFNKPRIDESYPLLALPQGQPITEMTNENYGALKVLCEQVAEAEMPGRVLHIRSGLIVGPFDPTNRFTYWPARLSEGGEVLAPVTPDQPVQFVDARDQAKWILKMAEQRAAGIFNLAGPGQDLTLGELLTSCQQVLDQPCELTWAEEEVLNRHEIRPWMGLPLWLPERMLAMSQVNIKPALAAGFQVRPIEETIIDTLNWYREQPPDKQWPAGISRQLERKVLRELKESTKTKAKEKT